MLNLVIFLLTKAPTWVHLTLRVTFIVTAGGAGVCERKQFTSITRITHNAPARSAARLLASRPAFLQIRVTREHCRATWRARGCPPTAPLPPRLLAPPRPPGQLGGGLVALPCGEKDVRLAQKTQAGPCIPVAIQLEKAEVGPTSGPTRRLSHFGRRRDQLVQVHNRSDPSPNLKSAWLAHNVSVDPAV